MCFKKVTAADTFCYFLRTAKLKKHLFRQKKKKKLSPTEKFGLNETVTWNRNELSPKSCNEKQTEMAEANYWRDDLFSNAVFITQIVGAG